MNNRSSGRCRTFVVLLTLATLALARPCVARAAEEDNTAEEVDIAGQYTCRGGNAGGGAYSGKVVITKTGQTYKVQWTIESGESHAGVAIREGNVLAVCYLGNRTAGVVAYKIHKDKDGPRLVGRWAGLGDQKTQSETLTQGAPPPKKSARGTDFALKDSG